MNWKSESHWFALMVKGEAGAKAAADDLREAGYETFAPMQIEREPETRKTVLARLPKRFRKMATRDVERPMFPGYLFVRLVLEEDGFVDLETAKGAIGFVRFDDAPARVPDWCVDRLMGTGPEVVVAEELRFVDWLRNSVARGKHPAVRVTDGPFLGFPAIVERMSARDRVLVLVKLFGQDTPLDLDVMQVELLHA